MTCQLHILFTTDWVIVLTLRTAVGPRGRGNNVFLSWRMSSFDRLSQTPSIVLQHLRPDTNRNG